MAVGAVETEAGVGIGVGGGGGPARRPAAFAPAEPAPIPAVMGHFARAHHDGGAVLRKQVHQIHVLAVGGGRRKHLLDHDGTVRHRRLALLVLVAFRAVRPEPRDHVRRIPDDGRRVRAVIVALPFAIVERAEEGTGVADALVALPAGIRAAMTIIAQEAGELGLVLVVRNRAGLAHRRLELIAERGICSHERLGPFHRTTRRGNGASANEQREISGFRQAERSRGEHGHQVPCLGKPSIGWAGAAGQINVSRVGE